jgi:hypothetical protein
MKRMRINWRPRELTWIKRRRKWERRKLHAAFVKHFRRHRDVPFGTFKSLCARAGWWTGRKSGRTPGYLLAYTKPELTWIKRRRAMPRRELHAAFIAAFPNHTISLNGFRQLCKAKGVMTGRDGRLVKGNIPANKGKKMPFNANSARTRFKKGDLPANTKYAGHERISKDGYVEISVQQINPHTGFERRHVLKHRWLWEQKHGPVPEGMCLKCKGDRLNTDPSNWELIQRALLPRLNSRWGKRRYDQAPSEVRPTIMAIAKLEQRLREKPRNQQSAKQE